MDIQIRPVAEADVPAIAAILRSTGWFHHMDEDGPVEAAERIRSLMALSRADQGHSLLGAYLGEDLVGYVHLHWLPYLFLKGPEGYVSELFVREEARGRGVGGRLLEAAKAEARARGCARLTLINGRDKESYRRGYYKSQGFKEGDKAVFIFSLGETEHG